MTCSITSTFGQPSRKISYEALRTAIGSFYRLSKRGDVTDDKPAILDQFKVIKERPCLLVAIVTLNNDSLYCHD